MPAYDLFDSSIPLSNEPFADRSGTEMPRWIKPLSNTPPKKPSHPAPASISPVEGNPDLISQIPELPLQPQRSSPHRDHAEIDGEKEPGCAACARMISADREKRKEEIVGDTSGLRRKQETGCTCQSCDGERGRSARREVFRGMFFGPSRRKGFFSCTLWGEIR